MNKKSAISKFKKIESLINELKQAGCNVFCIDNEKLVLETPDKWKENNLLSEEATERQMKSGTAYGSFNMSIEKAFEHLEYDYEISLT